MYATGDTAMTRWSRSLSGGRGRGPVTRFSGGKDDPALSPSQAKKSVPPSFRRPLFQACVVQDRTMVTPRRLRLRAGETPPLFRLPPSLPLLRANSEAGGGAPAHEEHEKTASRI
jgi:hypothetical protein